MPSHRPGSFLQSPPPRQLTPTPRPAAASKLKVLVAGVDKDARYCVETTVRQALADRPPSEEWTVSLVRLGSAWSVALNGPGDRFRNLSFTAEAHRLGDAIRESLAGGSGGAATASPLGSGAAPAAGPSGQGSGRVPMQDLHACGKCQQPIVVCYEALPDEPRERAPVACPSCWAVSHVEIGGWAAAGGDYSARKG